jgi:hypothetical protein
MVLSTSMTATLYESTELRWFRGARLPVDARILFRGEPGSPEPAFDQRSDVYVCSADEQLGVKLRGDRWGPRLDVKTRRSREPARIGTSAGFVESWIKWSWRGPEDPFEGAEPAAPWIRVEKVRYQWKFLAEGDSLRLVDGEETVAAGGTVELAELSVDGRAFWTVAAEAYGFSDEARRRVEWAAAKAISRLPDFVGGEGESYGYPRWLSVVRDARRPPAPTE